MLRRLLALLLVFLLAVSVISCGGEDDGPGNTDGSQNNGQSNDQSNDQGNTDSDIKYNPDGSIDLPLVDLPLG